MKWCICVGVLLIVGDMASSQERYKLPETCPTCNCSPARSSLLSPAQQVRPAPLPVPPASSLSSGDRRISQLTTIAAGMDQEITRLNNKVNQLESQLGRTIQVVGHMDDSLDRRISVLERARTETDYRLTALELKYGAGSSGQNLAQRGVWTTEQLNELERLVNSGNWDSTRKAALRRLAALDPDPAAFLAEVGRASGVRGIVANR